MKKKHKPYHADIKKRFNLDISVIDNNYFVQKAYRTSYTVIKKLKENLEIKNLLENVALMYYNFWEAEKLPSNCVFISTFIIEVIDLETLEIKRITKIENV